MRRTQKEKLETYTEIPLQAIPKTSKKANAVTAADRYRNQEKRKKEADKPLYFKRV
jgi:hypothetical protein